MTNDPKGRPLPKPLGVLALTGGLPELLAPDEVLELWFPRSEAKASSRIELERQAARASLAKAIEDGSIKVERDPDTKRTIHAPAGGVHASWRQRLSGRANADESAELWAKTAPWEVTDAGAVWLSASNFLAWAVKLPLLWPPASGCLLLQWVGPQPTAAVSSDTPKRIPAKTYLADVDLLIAAGIGVNNALRKVAAEKGVTMSALKKARSESSGGERNQKSSKAKSAPRLRLVRTGEK